MSDPIIAEIDRRITAYQRVRESLLDLMAAHGRVAPPVEPMSPITSKPARQLGKRAAKLKARLTGSSGSGALVLGAIKSGADTLAAIAKDCQVKPGTARTALLALEDAGRVTREGKSRATRYRLTHDK